MVKWSNQNRSRKWILISHLKEKIEISYYLFSRLMIFLESAAKVKVNIKNSKTMKLNILMKLTKTETKPI